MLKLLRLLPIVLITLLSLTSIHPSAAQTDCALPTRLVPGVEGRVLPATTNRLREAPSVDADILTSIAVGDRFKVIDGPQCASGYWWWQVDYNGTIGWTAEGEGTTYWVEPMLLPELAPLTTDNLAQIEPLAVIGTDPINQLAWSPDNQVILAAGSSGLWRFDISKPDQPRLIQGYDGFFRSVAYSPDGKTFATGNTLGQTVIWDAETLEPLQTLEISEDSVEALAYPSSGDFVASGGFDGIVQLWDIAQQAEMKTWQLDRGRISSLDFSPDDLRLAVGTFEYQNWIINLQSSATVALDDTVLSNSADFSPDGRFLITGQLGGRGDGGPITIPIMVWDAEEGSLVAAIETNTRDVFNVAFERQNSLIVNDGELVTRWDITPLFNGELSNKAYLTSVDFETTEIVEGSTYSYASISPDARTLAYRQDATIKLVDLASNKLISVLQIPYFLSGMDGLFTTYRLQSPIYQYKVSPTEPTIAFGKGTNLILWNYQTGIPETKLTGHNADIAILQFSHDGQKLVAGTNTYMHDYGPGGPSEIRIWDMTTHTYQNVMAEGMNDFTFNANDQLLSIAYVGYGSGAVREIFNLQTLQPVDLKLDDSDNTSYLVFHPSNPEIGLLAMNNRPDSEHPTAILLVNQILKWNNLTGGYNDVIEQQVNPWLQPVFSSSGDLLLIPFGSKWWLFRDDQKVAEGQGEEPYVFSPDGSLLAFRQDNQIVVWDTENNTELYRLPKEYLWRKLLFFGQDGKWLVTDNDIWNMSTQQIITEINYVGTVYNYYVADRVSDAQLTSDNKLLIVSDMGTIELWGVRAQP